MSSCHVDLHQRAELLWLEGLGFFLAGGCMATSSLDPESLSLSTQAFCSTTADEDSLDGALRLSCLGSCLTFGPVVPHST